MSVSEMLREKDREILSLRADLYWVQLEVAVLHKPGVKY